MSVVQKIAELAQNGAISKGVQTYLGGVGSDLERLATKAAKKGLGELNPNEVSQFRKIYADYLREALNANRSAPDLSVFDKVKLEAEIRDDFFNKVLGEIAKTGNERLALRATLLQKDLKAKNGLIDLGNGRTITQREYNSIKELSAAGLRLSPQDKELLELAQSAEWKTALDRARQQRSADVTTIAQGRNPTVAKEGQEAPPPRRIIATPYRGPDAGEKAGAEVARESGTNVPRASVSSTDTRPVTGILRQGDSPDVFAASLLQGKWKTKVEQGAFERFEISLRQHNLLQTSLNRPPLTKLNDIAKEVMEGRPITIAEFVKLKDTGGKMGVGYHSGSAVPHTPVVGGNPIANPIANIAAYLNPTRWVEGIRSAGRAVVNPLDAVESLRWNGLTSPSFIARALGTTALAGTIFGVTPNLVGSYWTADLSQMNVSSDKGFGVVLSFIDKHDLLGSADLETATGDSNTHYSSDNEYDQLVKGKVFNDHFLNRTDAIAPGNPLRDHLKQNNPQSGKSPELLKILYNIATDVPQQQALNNQMMVAYNAALSRNVGMIGTTEGNKTTTNPKEIANFIAERYADVVSNKLAGSTAEDIKFRDAFLARYYGPGIDINNSRHLVLSLGTPSNNPEVFSLDRQAIAQYLVNRRGVIGKIEDLMDNSKLNQIAGRMEDSERERSSAAAKTSAPVSIYGYVQGAPVTPSTQVTNSTPLTTLSGAVFKGRLDEYRDDGTITENTYKALSAAFAASTKAPVSATEELTSKNIAKGEELQAFQKAAQDIFTKDGVDLATATAVTRELIAPAPGR